MQTITTIGLDIAKSVFQVHGVDAEGNVVIRSQLKRRYVLAFFQKVPLSLRWCTFATVTEGTAMARYFAFFVVGWAFTLGTVAMVETHLVSKSAPQVVAYQNTR